jgi:oligogalacturonide lyase
MLNVARKTMKLYYMRSEGGNFRRSIKEIVEVNLASLLTDIESGSLKDESAYQRIRGTIPPEMGAGGDLTLDAGEEWIWYRVGKQEAEKHLPVGNGCPVNH